jgi:prevent-host-death family protein
MVAMKKRVSKTVFKANALQFLSEVEATGEPIIVTSRGRPVVELRRYESPRAILKGSVLFYERPFDPVGEDDWEALKDT